MTSRILSVSMLSLVVSCLSACDAAHPRCASPAFDTQGHRGAAALRPQNTLPAMEYALSKGVRTLEMDVAVTSDDVIVLSHDPVLPEGRCLKADGSAADGLKIRGMTLAEVRTLDCGSKGDDAFPNLSTVPGTPPPTLMEVFVMAETRSAGKVRYNIEPKMDPSWGADITPDAETFVRLLSDVIIQAGVGDRVTIQSFDPRPLRALAERESPLKRVVLFPSTNLSILGAWIAGNPIETAQLVGAVAISPYAPITFKPFVDDAHAKGFAVIPWTVNDREEMQRLVDIGVDGIISDDVDTLMAFVAEAQPTTGVCF